LRLALFLSAVAALCCFALMRKAEAKLGEALIRVGEQMLDLEGVHRQTPTRLFINGATIGIQTGTSTHSVSGLLERFAGHCKDNSSLALPTERLEDGILPKRSPSVPDSDGVLRIESEMRGLVLCLVGNGAGGLEGLTTAAEEFSKTGRFDAFGELRYLLAKPGVRGGTSYVMLWSQGPFDLGKMFPDAGDAPGRDPEGLPRLAELRRVMSVTADGAAQSFNLYTSPTQTVDELFTRYGAALESAGYRLASPESSATRDTRAARRLVARRDNSALSLDFSASAGDTHVAVIAL
jgi:hypothetical protein